MQSEQNPSETPTDDEEIVSHPNDINSAKPKRFRFPLRLFLYVAVFFAGFGSGFILWGKNPGSQSLLNNQAAIPSAQDNNDGGANLSIQVIMPESYRLPISYVDLGPRLIEAGAIDYDRFVQTYKNAGQPLTDAQKAVLLGVVDKAIIIDRKNAYFLLNFFWAFGLTNQNSILTEGPMMQNGVDQVGRFASTGGWTLGKKQATELFASTPLVTLTPEQQSRLELVAQVVFRPCCNNPTHFPDCNHGMAMLGMLELIASQNSSEQELFDAAKFLNAFWYPQQSFELALFMKADKGFEFSEIDSLEAVSYQYFSGSGSQTLHQLLIANGALEQAPGTGSGCGV